MGTRDTLFTVGGYTVKASVGVRNVVVYNPDGFTVYSGSRSAAFAWLLAKVRRNGRPV